MLFPLFESIIKCSLQERQRNEKAAAHKGSISYSYIDARFYLAFFLRAQQLAYILNTAAHRMTMDTAIAA